MAGKERFWKGCLLVLLLGTLALNLVIILAVLL